MVDRERIELSISGCKPDVFPLALTAHKIGGDDWSRTSSARGGGFTVHWGYQFSYISKIRISYLFPHKPLIERLLCPFLLFYSLCAEEYCLSDSGFLR